MNRQPAYSRSELLPAGLVLAGLALGVWYFRSDARRPAPPPQPQAAAGSDPRDAPDEETDPEPPLPAEPQARYKALPGRIRAYERTMQRVQADVDHLKRENENLDQRIVNLQLYPVYPPPPWEMERRGREAGMLLGQQLGNFRLIHKAEAKLERFRSRVEKLKEEYEDLRLQFETALPGKQKH